MKTKEPQYDILINDNRKNGSIKLGMGASHTYREDTRRLLFVMSRYKFVSKMFSGFDNVLEVGCGDGFGTKIIKQEVNTVHGIDFDPIFIDSARSTICDNNISFETKDILTSPMENKYSGIYSLDVMEHIHKDNEDLFIKNIKDSLQKNGVVIIGMPSLESQKYASEGSIKGHVNCKSGSDFKKHLSVHFSNVFLFSMNDEVVHTGYSPMSHYLIALCVV